MEFEQQLEQQQVVEVLQAVVELLNACDVTDARDCGWESTTHFGSVFELLMLLAKEPADKVRWWLPGGTYMAAAWTYVSSAAGQMW